MNAQSTERFERRLSRPASQRSAGVLLSPFIFMNRFEDCSHV
ncbi:MAG: hypothetical protein P9F19_14475 [Candidatus Contendobacter sp.]|nr:hypothetical protein [Candidatus Contendobacter sp.]MDG4558577.1 hypothetical protein [Candidatus Contendobacter sp.]